MANDRGFFSITPRADQVEKALRDLAHIKNGAPRAVAAALNKTIRGVRTDTIRRLATVYTAKRQKIDKAIGNPHYARPDRLTAYITGIDDSERRISLINFKVSPRRVTKRRPAVLHVQVLRGKASTLPGAFIANLSGGNVHVARRDPPNRMKHGKKLKSGKEGKPPIAIVKVSGPAIPSMMENPKVLNPVMTLAQARLDKALDHEIERIEKGFGK